MTGLIIENEWDVDTNIKAFLADNPELFSEVIEMTSAQHRFQEILSILPKIDAIIIATTWMYKDQVEDYIKAFVNPNFPKKLSFYIHYLVSPLNEWQYNDTSFMRHPELFEGCKQMLENGHKIYTFEPNYNSDEKIEDDLNFFHHQRESRYLYRPFELHYSKEHDIFYADYEGYRDLNSELEEFKPNLDKK